MCWLVLVYDNVTVPENGGTLSFENVDSMFRFAAKKGKNIVILLSNAIISTLHTTTKQTVQERFRSIGKEAITGLNGIRTKGRDSDPLGSI